jgi:nucleoside-diphosphate-sugar epimerase
MTTLITGGTGLVGSRLLRRFVDAGVDCRPLYGRARNFPLERPTWNAIFSMRVR